jgi:uncharacterized protein YyaL (SSP411 family)
MAVTALLRLAGLSNDLRYVDIAHQALAQMQGMLAQYPLGFTQWLQALAYALSKPREVAILGEPEGIDTQALLNVVRDGYRPYQVVAMGAPDRDTAVPLLGSRPDEWASHSLRVPQFRLPGTHDGHRDITSSA